MAPTVWCVYTFFEIGLQRPLQSPAEGQALHKGSLDLAKAMDRVEMDVLDMALARPPSNAMEEIQAYWQYLECTTPYCHGWLWRRHLNNPTWGIRCYVCRKAWRETFQQDGWQLWDPRHKRKYVYGT